MHRPSSAPAVSLDPSLDRNPKLATAHLGKEYRNRSESLMALDDVSLSVSSGQFVSVIGPSGCGKSTLLEILAGIQVPTAGKVLRDGEDITGQVGRVGYMPQKDLLLPWKSVLDNAAIGLELAGVGRRQAREETRAWLPVFGLAGFEDRYPRTLSGGMRQRAALLRTFLARRDTLLLDEPFGALDALTRSEMQGWLLDVWSEFGKTILLVTHDVDEAIYLSDEIVVMSPRPGRIVAVQRVPLERPRTPEVVTSYPFTDLKRKLLGLLRGGG